MGVFFIQHCKDKNVICKNLFIDEGTKFQTDIFWAWGGFSTLIYYKNQIPFF